MKVERPIALASAARPSRVGWDDETRWTALPVAGPFDLAASAAFLEGFTPASRPEAAAHAGELRFAFPCAPSWRPVGVIVRQEHAGAPVLVRAVADPSDVARAVASA